MQLTREEQAMLDGEHGPAVRKAMQILSALGKIYGAEDMIPVTSVQVAGVSYDNLGEAGLDWLREMADGGGRAQVLTTLNPAGLDLENWPALGIDPAFAERQGQVIEAFQRMGIIPSCTCTPYLSGNRPNMGEHIAWAESSAVCYANSVLGARTNREGGPSALAAALTGRTPNYGLHLDANRRPNLTVAVEAKLSGGHTYGALGKAIGERMQAAGIKPIPVLTRLEKASGDELKALCASLATYGGGALFHIQGITPEAHHYPLPADGFSVTAADLADASQSMSDADPGEIDFASLGCPHLSIDEIAYIARLLDGKRVHGELWLTTARATRREADRLGYSSLIEASGAKFAADTCCVVAPIQGRFTAMAADSAKACYYAAAKHRLRTWFGSVEEVIERMT